MNIFEKITNSYHKKTPFVAYRKFNEAVISGFFMDNDSLFFVDDFSEKGFVFAPFDNQQKAILFPINNSEFISEDLSFDAIKFKEKDFCNNDSSQEQHIKLVDKTIEEISNNGLKKVVISRKEDLEISDFNLIKTYQKLLQTYQNAFVYVWFHPKIGLWLGATPETLLNIENNTFKTMSLAGTQVYENTKNIVWKSKELEEQQLVTDFIESQLTGISSNLKIDKKETIKAGSLLHLRTKVTGELNENSTLKTLIRALHPTPAVCGLPRGNAKKFILANEFYSRSFYTGFLGELNLQKNKIETENSSLFVNLRCMNILDDNVSLFVGGGITKDSIPKNEWEETVSKSKVMKRVL
ncbi:chorismate-binding protein [Polaribacter sp. Hel1_33_49]|uniref:chorismate-binding protein n=1 Tax=Polaribacter sp. Hel1_33_49 TaxID=1336803 RepID=UPI00052BD7C3|nr:chorismate-binding protein [Polaribacter sp. Hel1_33_49]KGL60658.1 isochorismate synthase [Polaribacter sp. Hel1_33_49]